MPRRRATKLTSRAKPKLPDGEEGIDMSKENRKAKLETLLTDFDMEVKSRLAQMEAECKSICKAIHRAVTMELLKMPHNIKKMMVAEFFANGGAFNEAALNGISEQVSSLASSVGAQSMMESKSKAHTANTASQLESREIEQPAAPKRGRGRKVAIARTSQRASSRTKKTSEDAMPTQTRKSTRTTRSRNTTSRSQFETPTANTGKTGLAYAGFSSTPMVTPKFDPRLPMTPGLMREAHRGETIISMSGSPINNPSRLDCTKPGMLTLGNGKVLDVTCEDAENLAMDETTRKNIQLLQENLTRILQRPDQE